MTETPQKENFHITAIVSAMYRRNVATMGIGAVYTLMSFMLGGKPTEAQLEADQAARDEAFERCSAALRKQFPLLDTAKTLQDLDALRDQLRATGKDRDKRFGIARGWYEPLADEFGELLLVQQLLPYSVAV